MNIQDLYAALQPFQDAAAGTLRIQASQITDWPAVHDLLVSTLAADTLSITDIGTFPPAPTSNVIRYQGQAALFPWAGEGQAVLPVTATFTVDQAGFPQLVVRAEVPAGWQPTFSFTGLVDTALVAVSFESGVLLVTSYPVTVSDFSAEVLPYIGFAGRLAVAGPFSSMLGLLPTPDSRQLEGRIDLSRGSMPVLSLAPVGGAPITLPGVAAQFFFGANVHSEYRTMPYSDPDDPIVTTITLPFSGAELQASLAWGDGPALVFSMPVLPASDFFVLSVTAARPLASWAQLDALVPGIDLAAAIPAGVPAAAALVLREFTLSLYYPSSASLPTVSSLTFDVMMETGDWALLPNKILTLQRVGAAMTVLFAGDMPRVTGSLYSNFTIVEEVEMAAALSIPRLVFTANLPANVPVSVESLMASVMDKLTGHRYAPPIAMEIAQLEMSVDVRNRAFGFAAEILTNWTLSFGAANGGTLITLSFQGIQFEINYDGQLLQAGFTALAGINEGRFYFSAISPGNGVGWAFAGGLVEGSTLSITNLLLSFMYPSGSIPGGSYGIPNLVIDKLAATLATDATNTPSEYTFEGGLSTSWDFSVFPGSPTLTLSAEVSLHGTRLAAPITPRLALPGQSLLPPAAAPVSSVADDAPWQISGAVRGTFSLYGLLISAGYEFSPANSALSFGIWYKQRGIQATLTQQVDKKTQEKQSILTIRLGDLSLGEILEYLIDLALPGGNRRLSTPWDVLYQINFKNLSLVVNLATSDIGIDYKFHLDLGFAQFTRIGLRYTSVNGEGRVYLELDGEFLGQPFGGDDDEPLSWDVLNDAAPEVPGKGPTLLDLRYVGFGQHLALSVPIAELDTVEKVLTALKASMKPVSGSGNPLTDPASAALRYDGNSNWLFGLDATILDTVSLSAVFLDPALYGGLISLAGDRAGALAGLRFELLYRKITEDIGELSADLRVPDLFRHLEFGEVSITLGTIHVDIYTNGNFRIDLGFPHNQDFSQSFAVEVFPFVGEGGFYFAYLTGATSDRVPAIKNGVFSPVIEAGVGLAVGLGKDFQAGPLKAGLKIEVYGIFEGVFAPFNPYDRSIAADNYYWIQGTAGIVGTLYGSVDFVVIKAEVSIVARASVSFVLEAHRPSLVELKLTVTARAKVKILFITVHFSFDFTLEESFVLGSTSSTPWIPGTDSQRLAAHSYLGDALRLAGGVLAADGESALPRLRQQRGQLPVRQLSRLRHARLQFDSLAANPDYRSLHQASLIEQRGRRSQLTGSADQPAPWPPLPVYGAGAAHTARLQFLPMFTVADPATLYARDAAAGTGGNQLEIVLGFIAENTTDPDVHGPQAIREVATDHLHHLDVEGNPALATMVETFFRWAAQAGASKVDDQNLSLLALQDLLVEVSDPAFQQATFGYQNLTQLLGLSLHFEIVEYPSGPAPSDTSGTFVPVPPDITATLVGASTVARDYSSYNPVSTAYAANLAAYFQQLLTNATSGVAPRPGDDVALAEVAPVDISAASLAELIFGEYFALLTQAAVQAAIALLQNYPVSYPATGGQSLTELAGGFATLYAPVTLASGQRLLDLAMFTGHHPDQLAAANPLAAAGASRQVDVPIGVSPLSIAEDNNTASLANGLSVPMPTLAYQVRSGQSLSAIAAAIPFVSPATALTGVTVGTASQRIAGLLRAGEALQLPSFSYQPVTGDTQNYLSAFLRVRNLGLSGIDHLDWYEQAISTMNPTVDWTTLSTASAPLVVPAGYLNSAPAAAAYPVHAGDTLARVAGSFALFQAMDNTVNPVLSGPVIVPAVAHPITAIDTFESLVSDFPGLPLADLLATNAAAPVLTPLAVLRLPTFTASVPVGQSLHSLAAAYDLSLPDLVDIVQGLPALFAGGPLNIRDVPARTVKEFVDDLKTTGQLNTVATQLSNFLAHGLRAPAPADTTFTDLTPQQVAAGDFTGALYGISDLIGQQFSWPDPSLPVTATLTHAAGDWLSFVAASTVTDAGMPITADLLAANPRLAAGETARPGMILVGTPITEISLSIDQARFSSWLPATTVTLNASPPAALANFEQTRVHYNFQVTQHWQAGARPALPNGPAAGAPGEPSLWPLPANLQLVAATGAGDPFTLDGVALSAAPGTDGAPLSCYCWAIQLPIGISRVANPNDPGDTATPASGAVLGSPWLDGVYLVRGAVAADTQRLYELWTYLAAGTDSAALSLLYAPNATGSAPKGYACDAVDPAGTVLLKTNLSTVTRDPGLRAADEVPSASTYSAAITDSVDFLSLLWQASVVVEGGFYLRYDAAGAGLPDSVFDETGRGSLQVLCLLHSQSSIAGGPLLALNNVAVVGDNVDASAVQVYAVRSDAAAPMTRVATVAAGSVGFEIVRVDPAPPAGTAPTPQQLAGMLYGLFGYRIDAGSGFVTSNEAVPQGPAPESGDVVGDGPNVSYRQVLSVYRRATAAGRIAQANRWLPAASDDPYAGISATGAAALSFAAHDVFGNRAIIADPVAGISLADRYLDRLAGVGDWPGTTWAYTLTGTAPTAAIEIDAALQANSYLPDPTVPSERALRSASSHAIKLGEAFYQLSRPGIELSVSTTLAADPLRVELAPLIGYLSASYAFTSQLAGLAVKTHQVSGSQDLATVAASYSVSAETLLRDNLDRPVNALFASIIVAPVYDQLKHGETLDAFAASVSLTAPALLGQWDNAAAVIPAGTDLVIVATTAALAAGKTLADYAGVSQCTAGDIARANSNVPGLIADGVSVSIGAVLLSTKSSTFDSLVTDFAGAGVTTSVEEIGTRNQDVRNLFTGGGAVTSYRVDRRLLTGASTVASVLNSLFGNDLTTFCALNGTVTGLIVQDSRFQVAASTLAAPTDTLRHYLIQTSGVTVADFATANQTSLLSPGSVLLLPALLDPASLAATPYGIQPGKTFGQLATLFGVSAELLGEQDQDIAGIFVPGQPVAVAGFGSVHTGPADSLESLLGKFPAGQQPSLAQLIAAITDQQGLLLAGAALVCPVPLAAAAGAGAALSIATLASAFLSAADGLRLAKSNAALAGFLKQGAAFTIGGQEFTVGQWQTLANTLGTVNSILDTPLGYDAFLTAMLDQPVIDPANKVLLPPPGVTLRAPLPAAPAVTDVITPLALSLTLSRPVDEIDPNFVGVPQIQQTSTLIPPAATGEPATLTGFASAVAQAYGGALWLGTAAAAEQGLQRQYLVRFAQPMARPVGNAIRAVAVGGSASFLGLPPLANSLISRTTDVRTYLSATEPPFSQDSQQLMFQAVDVTDWARDFLATLDLVLSPSYAAAGYLATAGATGSAPFDALVAAKAVLASKISVQLAPVEVGDSALDLAAAQQALAQLLSSNLSAGYDTDAVVQLGSTVQASFAGTGADAGGHRLTGKIAAVTQGLSTSTTLQQLAGQFVVSVEAVTELLSATTNILHTGTVLEMGAASWTIGQHDSLGTGIAALHTTVPGFASSFASTASLFREATLLTIDGFSATAGFGDTLASMADALDVDIAFVGMANQDLTGLLTGTVYLRGTPVPITPQISSLASLASQQGIPVQALVGLIAGQAVLTIGAILHIVRWVPEYSLSTGKIDLDVADGALTLLLTLKSRANYRRLFLNLDFGISALEYAVEPAAYVEGYQSSKWLHLVNPLPATPAELGGAVISTGIGQLDIPIALRAYPVTPRLVNQRAQPSYTEAEIAAASPLAEQIARAEAWSYYAGFELQLAAQDTATVTIGLNFGPTLAGSLDTVTDPFPALAEYTTNAAAIKADLVTLIKPAAAGNGAVTPGQSALVALAELATKVAGSWGNVPAAPAADPADAGDGLVPAESYAFQLQTRNRSDNHGEPLLYALVLIRATGTDSWGPAGSIPALGYLDDAGQLRPLRPPIPPVGQPPQTLTYLFEQEVPDAGRRVYLIWYDDLNVIAYQNARASLAITRNQNLTPGKVTNEQFVYRTPQLTFTNLAVPSLQWDESVLFGTGPVAQLPAALGTVFTDVLGSPPTSARTEQKLNGSYGYRLAAAGAADSPLSPQDLVSLTPMFYRPNFDYTDTVPTDTGAAVTEWFGSHLPQPANVAFLSLDLQIFSTMTPGRMQPLVRFSRLDYQIPATS